MSGDELVKCRGCGELFPSPRPTRGPRATCCTDSCRTKAYRDRQHLEAATEAADLALSAPHGRLTLAVHALGPAAAMRLRALLRDASDRNLSTRTRDELCSPATSDGGAVVADLHTSAGGLEE